jgi:hypothetical protein
VVLKKAARDFFNWQRSLGMLVKTAKIIHGTLVLPMKASEVV